MMRFEGWRGCEVQRRRLELFRCDIEASDSLERISIARSATLR